jgi:hypothetical protein
MDSNKCWGGYGEISILIGKIYNGAVTLENNLAFLQTVKHKTTI